VATERPIPPPRRAVKQNVLAVARRPRILSQYGRPVGRRPSPPR